MKDLARLLFRFDGRIGRLQFWMACIVLGVLMVLLGLVQALVELALAHKSGTLDALVLADGHADIGLGRHAFRVYSSKERRILGLARGDRKWKDALP